MHLMRTHKQRWGMKDERQAQSDDDQQEDPPHSIVASTIDATTIAAIDAILSMLLLPIPVISAELGHAEP